MNLMIKHIIGAWCIELCNVLVDLSLVIVIHIH